MELKEAMQSIIDDMPRLNPNLTVGELVEKAKIKQRNINYYEKTRASRNNRKSN